MTDAHANNSLDSCPQVCEDGICCDGDEGKRNDMSRLREKCRNELIDLLVRNCPSFFSSTTDVSPDIWAEIVKLVELHSGPLNTADLQAVETWVATAIDYYFLKTIDQLPTPTKKSMAFRKAVNLLRSCFDHALSLARRRNKERQRAEKIAAKKKMSLSKRMKKVVSTQQFRSLCKGLSSAEVCAIFEETYLSMNVNSQ